MDFKINFLKRIAIAMMALALSLAVSPYPALAGVTTTTSDALGTVTDIIVGHDNKGPYSLSWTQIDSSSITAVLNGRTLRKDTDYNIDATNGIISFNSVLLNDAIVHVSYKKTTSSKSNTGAVSVPVSLNLMEGRTASLSVTGLYAQDADSSGDGKTVIGVGGNKTWSGGKVESLFLMSQQNSDVDDTDESMSTWDRSAMKLGDSTTIGGLKLTGSYTRAGSGFLGSKEYSMKAGQQAMNIAGAYDLSKSFQATFKFNDTDQTSGDDQGAYSRVNEQGMTFAPTGATNISIAHSTTETGNTTVDDSEKTVESEQLKISQGIGAKTKATVSVQNVSTTDNDSTDQVQTRQASITTTAVPGMNVQGAVVQKDSQTDGAEQNMSAAVTVSPISQVNVKAAFSQTDSEKNGQSASTNLTVKLKPVESLLVEGKIIDKSQNEDENFQRDLSLSATPIKNAKLTAQFSQKGENELDDVTKGAALEVSPFSNTKLSAGLKYVESGESILTIHDYAASTSPWRFISLSGSFRDRELLLEEAVDTKKLNLALAPLSFINLTGDYQENPEDTSGNIQQYKSTAMGMKLKFGSFGLLTNYTTKDEYACSRMSDEREVGLEMAAFGHGKLKTTYKIARVLDGSETSNAYSLGYEHSLGSDFSLSLTGYYYRYLEDQMVVPDKSEYKSELNLGIKF
jgi:hypothetical protein